MRIELDFSEPDEHDDIVIYHPSDDIEIVSESECPYCGGGYCDWCV